MKKCLISGWKSSAVSREPGEERVSIRTRMGSISGVKRSRKKEAWSLTPAVIGELSKCGFPGVLEAKA